MTSATKYMFSLWWAGLQGSSLGPVSRSHITTTHKYQPRQSCSESCGLKVAFFFFKNNSLPCHSLDRQPHVSSSSSGQVLGLQQWHIKQSSSGVTKVQQVSHTRIHMCLERMLEADWRTLDLPCLLCQATCCLRLPPHNWQTQSVSLVLSKKHC